VALPHVVIDEAPAPERAAWVGEVRRGLAAGTLAPYLGTGVTGLTGTSVPTSYEALAAFLGSKVSLPKRARGNVWASAQYIESQKHRSTLDALLSEAFATPVAPTGFHAFLARLPLPLIVDTWYDGAMRSALAGRSDWGEIQGTSRAKLAHVRWTQAYDAQGAPAPDEQAAGWKTLLYKPHGCVAPEKNFLAADSDYVETLTEIDIQTPIPEEVRRRREGLGFVFLGCRFHDQLLRTYARQIAKRSRGPHFVVLETGTATRNERRFVGELGMTLLSAPLAEVLAELAAPRETAP